MTIQNIFGIGPIWRSKTFLILGGLIVTAGMFFAVAITRQDKPTPTAEDNNSVVPQQESQSESENPAVGTDTETKEDTPAENTQQPTTKPSQGGSTGGGGTSGGGNTGGGTSGGAGIAYASASNTGPSNPGTITAAGFNNITSPGVYENLAFNGTVNIQSSNVTLRNCTVTGGYYFGIRIDDIYSNIIVEDCSLTGTVHDNGRGIAAWGDNITLRRLDISGYTDGISSGNGGRYSTIYIHDLTSAVADPHYDGIEIYGGNDIIIEYCTIDNTAHNQTSAINIANDFGSISNVIVRNNRLMGGGYTFYARGNQPGGNGTVTDITVQNNRFLPGFYGIASIEVADVSWTGNVHDTTGHAISP